MFKKALNHSLKVYSKQARKCSSQVAPHFEAETIHELRTSTKKLRALFQLITPAYQPVRLTKRFKELYHISGSLRDIDNFLVQLNKKQLLADTRIQEWLNRQTNVLKYQWIKRYSKMAVIRMVKFANDHPTKHITEEGIDKTCNKLFKNIEMVLNDPYPNDEKLHGLRKHLKRIQYITDWALEENTEKPERYNKYHPSLLKELSSMAGNYNDLRIWMDYLDKYAQDENVGHDEIAGVIELKHHWELKKAKLREHLIGQILNYINLNLKEANRVGPVEQN